MAKEGQRVGFRRSGVRSCLFIGSQPALGVGWHVGVSGGGGQADVLPSDSFSFTSCLFPLLCAPPPQVDLMEAILNYYALHTLYPSLNGKPSCFRANVEFCPFCRSQGSVGLPLNRLSPSSSGTPRSWSSRFVGKADV